MKTTVTSTKIIVPRRRPDLLTRKRLLDLLDDLLDFRLTLVAAPAGYGKTSLLVDLAHQVEYPVCWYALDPLDKDLHRFITHFVAAIQQRFPNFGKNSLAVLHNASQVKFDLNRMIATIVNDAYEHISEHFVIILDDYHLLDDSEKINQFISGFVQDMDENCHLVIASRSLLTLPSLPLMVGRSQVKGLSFDELAFRPEEIQSLLFQNYHQTISEEEAKKLSDETEGWITGLLLSAEAMWQGMSDRVRVARVSGVDLYDYLAQQVLDQQTPQMQSFLLRTALLGEFNAALCEDVLGDAPEGMSWPQLITDVVNNNLFVQPVENGGTWIRYHHLFRDFLQDQLSKKLPDEERRILRRMVTVYAEREEWEQAYAACQRLGDEQITVALVDQAGLPMMEGGQMATLAAWIDALPPDTIKSHPMLLSRRGAAAIVLGEAEKGLRLLNQAITKLQGQKDRKALVQALVWRASAFLFLGRYPETLESAQEAIQIVERIDILSSSEAEALRMEGLGWQNLGRANRAIAPLEQSLSIYDELGSEENAALVHLDLGLANMSLGQYRLALDHYQFALEIWRKNNNLTQQANLLNNLGVLTHHRGDLVQAEAYLGQALACARQSGYARIEAFSLTSLGDLYSDLELYDTAIHHYKQAEGIADHIEERFLLLYTGMAQAKIARLRDQTEEALQVLASREPMVQESNSSYASGLWLMENGCLSLSRGKHADAVAFLQKAIQDFENGGQCLETAQAYLYLALAQHNAGNKAVAWEDLRRAFMAASNLDGLYPLVISAKDAKEMLSNAENNLEIREQVTSLLDQIQLFENERPGLRRQLREHGSGELLSFPDLMIQALGEAQVEVNGEALTKPEWANQRKVRELFFLILAHPDGLTREAIEDALWPSSSPSKHKSQFKNAMYRLRRAFEDEWVLFDQKRECYIFNWKLDYQYDVELYLNKTEAAQETTHKKDQVAAYEEAIALYGGTYLPKIDGIWAAPIRAHLRRLFSEMVLRVAEHYFESGEYEQTLGYCRRLLSEDPCQEAAHRLAMRVHAARGERTQLALQYERCRQVLKMNLDVAPAHETEALFERLMDLE